MYLRLLMPGPESGPRWDGQSSPRQYPHNNEQLNKGRSQGLGVTYWSAQLLIQV